MPVLVPKVDSSGVASPTLESEFTGAQLDSVCITPEVCIVLTVIYVSHDQLTCVRRMRFSSSTRNMIVSQVAALHLELNAFVKNAI